MSVLDFTMSNPVLAWLKQVNDVSAVSPMLNESLDGEVELCEREERYLQAGNNTGGGDVGGD
jgi:hypothetical protein